jgi:hypothetical protein
MPKGGPKLASMLDGRRGLSDDENRRGSFRPRGYASRLLTVHGELSVNAHTAGAAVPHGTAPPQVAFRPSPGPFAPDGYARSIARFAALLGPKARQLAMQRAAEAADPLPPRMPLLPPYPRPAAPIARPVGAQGSVLQPAAPRPPVGVHGSVLQPAAPRPPVGVQGSVLLPAAPRPPIAVHGSVLLPAAPRPPMGVQGSVLQPAAAAPGPPVVGVQGAAMLQPVAPLPPPPLPAAPLPPPPLPAAPPQPPR